MIDLKRLRDDAEYRRGIERKRVQARLVDELLKLDDLRRQMIAEVDQRRAAQNAASKEVAQASPEERQAKILRAGELKVELSAQEEALRVVEEQLRDRSLEIPNAADPAVPDGGEEDAEVLKVVGATPEAPALDHAALADALGFVDAEHAAEASGSRFAYIMREAALLELALVNYAMEAIVRHGFIPVITPGLVRERTMEEAGFFPTDRNQVYDVDKGTERELFLLGTSEVALSALHRAETFTPERLPARYGGYSTCYRREAGTYGKDTRGIFRVHQFDKVEMFAFAMPESSAEEHERILAIEEEIIGGLGLPYRVVNIAAGDLGPAAAKKYDLEAWLPSEGQYRELTSCSNYTDYSARRLNTRVKDVGGSTFVHTLNGTACAVSRTLVFLFEYCQQPDGAFVVPEVLRRYTGFEVVKP
jgi:seryl-tRNA synthetase